MATLEELAREVIQGQWGNGNSRKSNLEANGYDYASVQNVVNQMLNGSYNGGANYEAGGSSQASSPVNTLESQISAQRQKLTNLGDKPKYVSNYQDTINNLTKQYTGMGDYVSEYADEIQNLNNLLDTETYYNPDTDSTFQQYKKDYTRNGQTASSDVLAKVSSRTGGLASSYAQYVAQQTYDNYMKELASKIPELKEMAYNKTKDSLNRYENLDSIAKQDYTNKRNKLAQDISAYESLENAAYQKYLNERDDWYKNWSRENDVLNLLLKQRDEELAAQQAAQAAAAASRRSSGGGNNNNNNSPKQPTGSYNSVRNAVVYSLKGPHGNASNAERLLTEELNNGSITLAEANKIAKEVLGREK